MLQHYEYPFKVWLTSVLLGSLLYYLYDLFTSLTYRSEYMTGSDPFFLVLIVGASMALSIPGFILFVVLYDILMNSRLSAAGIKLIVLLVSQIVINTSIYIIYDGGANHSVFEYLHPIAPFSFTAGFSILFYKLNKTTSATKL